MPPNRDVRVFRDLLLFAVWSATLFLAFEGGRATATPVRASGPTTITAVR